jgi:hypothetical protein
MPPDHPENYNKIQYEYMVLATMQNYAKVPLNHAIVADEFGAADNFNDRVLQYGQRVIVMCPMGNLQSPIILSCLRNTPKTTDSALGLHWRRRFNKVEQIIDKDFNYMVKSDSGPNLKINTNKIVLDDGSGDNITIDKDNKIITINCKDFTAKISGNASIEVGGSATVKAESADVTVSGKCTVKAGSLDATVDGEAKVKAGGDVNIDGSTIKLNGSIGKVLTDMTQPRCYITGIPFIGSTKVKAGG